VVPDEPKRTLCAARAVSRTIRARAAGIQELTIAGSRQANEPLELSQAPDVQKLSYVALDVRAFVDLRLDVAEQTRRVLHLVDQDRCSVCGKEQRRRVLCQGSIARQIEAGVVVCGQGRSQQRRLVRLARARQQDHGEVLGGGCQPAQ